MESLPVTNYHFEDENSEPVSFHVLPIEWGNDKAQGRQGGKRRGIHLRGEADNGLEKVHRPVFAWKVDLFSVKPVISVLSGRNKWILLQRPRKCFERIIKPILVTLHCVSYLIRNPEASAKSMWEYLADVFSTYEVKPCQSDLEEHMPFISEAVECEDALAKSKFIINFLIQEPTNKKLPDEDIRVRRNPGWSTYEIFENVCAFCDNGGDLLCCEGRCLRSFHATVKDGEDYSCESLGFTQDEVDAIRRVDFYCKNCQYKQHQCYACGTLGSSDKSFGAEVFPCTFARCGHFYHPHCIAKYETRVFDEELEKRIMLGESFTCPIHKCCSCKKLEADTRDPELQFAVCRRCPTSYHRKCLPRDIHFAKDKDDEDTEIRAWEGLLSNRVLIYCTKHKMVKTLGTPRRDQCKFPDVTDKEIAAEKKTSSQEKKKSLTSESHVVGENSVSRRDHVKFPDVNDMEIAAEKKTYFKEKKRRLTSESHVVGENSMTSTKKLSSEGLHKEENAPTPMSRLISAAKAVKHRLNSAEKKTCIKEKKRRLTSKSHVVGENSVTRREMLSSEGLHTEENAPVPMSQLISAAKAVKHGLNSAVVNPSSRESSSPPASLDPATKMRIDALMKLGAAAIANHRVLSTRESSERTAVEMHIPLRKMDCS